ncbi:hypothetical protein ACE14D_25620, partial [Streptomyces sp. Act-28]
PRDQHTLSFVGCVCGVYETGAGDFPGPVRSGTMRSYRSSEGARMTGTGERVGAPRVVWEDPRRPALPALMDALGLVAAPLMAGAAIATAGVLGADADKFRWPALSMLLFTGAAVALLTAIQVSLSSRRFLYSSEDVRLWAAPPTVREEEQAAGRRAPEEHRAEAQRRDFARWLWYSERATWAYQAGIVLLGIGFAGMVAPPSALHGADAVHRWIASGVVLGALVTHVVRLTVRVFGEMGGSLRAVIAALVRPFP